MEMMYGISIENLISIFSNGGIIVLMTGTTGSTTEDLVNYLVKEFTESKSLQHTTICESNLATEIVQCVHSFFTKANSGEIRKDERGMMTFLPEKPSLLFLKKINKNIWNEPSIEILTDMRDTVKYIKLFSTSCIETIPLHIRKQTDAWIITKDCSREAIFTIFSSILKNYNFEDFMYSLNEYRVIIICRKGKFERYKIYFFADVCPSISMDIVDIVESFTYRDISKIILDYSYRVR